MKHPLTNPESPYYKMVDGIEAITRMEQMYSKEELMNWAKITMMKYRLRVGSKNILGDLDKSILSDVHKILGYEEYYKYLKEL